MIDSAVLALQQIEHSMIDRDPLLRKLSTFVVCLLMTHQDLPHQIKGPLSSSLNAFE